MDLRKSHILGILLLLALAASVLYVGTSYDTPERASNIGENSKETERPTEGNGNSEPEPYWQPENESSFSEAIENREEGEDISEWWPEDVEPPKITDEHVANTTRLRNRTVGAWGPNVTAHPIGIINREGDWEARRYTEVERGTYGFFASHKGNGEFTVRILDEEGEVARTVVNTSGDWQGRKVFHLDAGSYSMRIDAEGGWVWSMSKLEINGSVQEMTRINRFGSYSEVFGPFTTGRPSEIRLSLNSNDTAEVYLVRQNFAEPVRLIETSENSSVVYSEPIPHYIVVETNSDGWRLSIND